MKVLAIDPGLSGGAAVVEVLGDQRARFVDVIDIPTAGEGPKRRVDIWPLVEFITLHAPDAAVIERAQAMPDQGASSGFNYGRAVGALEAVIQGCRVPMTVIESTAWKKFHGLIKTDKENSRQRALMRFPDSAAKLARKMDHNRAEAVLMAEYGAALVRNKQISVSGFPRA